MTEFKNWLDNEVGMSAELQSHLLATLLAIAVIWLLRLLILRVVLGRTQNITGVYRARKVASYVAGVLIVFVLGRIWLQGFESITTFLGLLSAGIAIALKDPIVDLAGWLFILWRKPFELGDRIQMNENAGDVVDIRILQFTVLEIGNWVDADQSTGRVIHIPNGSVFHTPVANYTRGFNFLWNEIAVLVTFESNWEKAKKLLLEIANRTVGDVVQDADKQIRNAARSYMIHYKNLTPIVYTTVKDSGVMLTIRYLTPARQRRGTSQTLWEEILLTFRKHSDIDLAYPTQRFYDNPTEGKPGAGGPAKSS